MGAIVTAYVTGTSARRVDNLAKPLRRETHISKSTESRICGNINREVEPVR